MVSQINIYANNKPVTDVGELKNKWDAWKRVKTMHVPPAQTELRFDFSIPIVASNFLIEYAAFHEQGVQAEKLQCPRCSRTVTDKHGICKHCGDNAYQCRHCRNINYEKLDAFLCNECGFCKHARFDFTLVVKPSYVVERISSEAERAKLVALIDSELQNANKRYTQLSSLKRPIEKLCSNLAEPHQPSPSGTSTSGSDQLIASLPGASALKINRKISILAMLNKESQTAHESLFKSTQTLQAARAELLRYMQSGATPALSVDSALSEETELPLPPSSDSRPAANNQRFDCAAAFVLECLMLFEGLAAQPALRNELLGRDLIPQIIEMNLCSAARRSQLHATRLLCLLCCRSPAATEMVNRLLGARLELGLEHYRQLPTEGLMHAELALLCELCLLQDELWPMRLQLLMKLFIKSLGHLVSAFICEQVVLPCLRVIGKLCAMPSSAAPSAAPQPTGRQPLVAHAATPGSATGGATGTPQARVADSATLSGAASLLAPANVASSSTPPDATSATASQSPGGGAAPPLVSEVTTPVRFSEWMAQPVLTFETWCSRSKPVAATHPSVDATTPAAAPMRAELTPAEATALRLGRRWRARSCRWGSALPLVGNGNWLCDLLLCEASQALREEAAGLVRALTEQKSARTCSFLEMLIGILPRATMREKASSEYFELLRSLMAPDDVRLFLVARGLLSQLCNLIGEEARRVRSQEESCMVDLSQGLVLKTLIELLQSLLELPTITAKLKREEQMPVLLHALLCVRGLVMQKTIHTDECATKLMAILTGLHEECEVERRRFMAACVSAMREQAALSAEPTEHRDHPMAGRALLFIFEQLCSIVCPERPEPEYKLQLNKAATQEEFIRGTMTKNPYSCKAVGPLMRDVKNKICRDLDLGGLIEDDNGMELLVAGQIIKLDLPVIKVYEQVWARSAAAQTYGDGNSAMVVVYRLQGLDGEATEPIVETVNEDLGEELDPEAEFAISAVVGETGGLEVMMDILCSSSPLLRVSECVFLLLKLLQHCCKIQCNRKRMLSMGASRRLLQVVPEALQSEALGGVAERLLLSVEPLLEEELRQQHMQSPTEDVQPMQVDSGAADESQAGSVLPMETDHSADLTINDLEVWRPLLHELLRGLESPAAANNKGLVRVITRTLPLVAHGSPELLAELFEHFAPFANFDEYDGARQPSVRHTFMLEALVGVLSLQRAGEAPTQILKDVVLEQGLVAMGAAYLVRHLPAEREKDSQQVWNEALGRPALPFVLQLLGGLARGHEGIQQVLLAPDVMTRLHALERQSSSASKAIGTWAEALLEALRERAAAEVDRLRRATLETKRKAALDKRQQILSSMGMKVKEVGDSDGNTVEGTSTSRAVIVSDAAANLMEDLQEESGHTCVVCGEGEAYRPGEVMGTYCFSKRVPLIGPAEGSGSCSAASLARQEQGYTTVTHFNVIHVTCHKEASAAERALKQPKEEWEGATLRNSQTKCNALWPFWGASVSEEAYACCIEGFWGSVQNTGRVDAPRCRLLAHDLKLLLMRFAYEESFSHYSKGGGRESNIKLVPYMIQMTSFLLDANGEVQRRSYQRTLSAFLADAAGSNPRQAAGESVYYQLVLSLVLQSATEWQASRLNFLRSVLRHCGTGAARERAALQVPGSPLSSPLPGPARSPLRAPGRSPGFGAAGMSPGLGAATISPGEPEAVMLPPAAAPSTRSSDIASLFTVSKPGLVFMAIIDKLHDVLKGKRSWQPQADGKPWTTLMRERLRYHDQAVLSELSEFLGEYQDELLQLGDFQEAFDVLGLLGEVLQADSSVESFVRAARPA